MSDATSEGRRERKKAATRSAIIEAATELFLERGFDAVTIRDIADRADVTPKTLYLHFAQKEALLFSDEAEQQERLVVAVRDRKPGSTIAEALKAHYLAEYARMSHGPQRELIELMEKTPSLADYAEKMWFRHEDALAAAIAAELSLSEPSDEIRFYSRFALHIQLVARRDSDPEATIDAGFRVLEDGWARYCAVASRG